MNVFCLGSEQIDDLWPAYGHHLERFEAEFGEEYAGQIRADLRAANKQLFGIQDDGKVIGILVTRIVDTPKGLLCEVFAVCGDAPDIRQAVIEVFPHIEKWAASEGCNRMKVCGRNGWKKILTDYRQTGVVMEKELSDGS